MYHYNQFFEFKYVANNNFSESDSENEDLSESENCVNVAKVDECRDISSKPLYALILTPTRELAVQIKNHLIQAAKYTDIKVKFF